LVVFALMGWLLQDPLLFEALGLQRATPPAACC
jgi:hypothetical protein